ncbi:hypothetical protein D1872_346750 [compost metagenome]
MPQNIQAFAILPLGVGHLLRIACALTPELLVEPLLRLADQPQGIPVDLTLFDQSI